MHENKGSGNFRSFVKEKGYYIALVLCVAAIGISGYVYYRNTKSPQKEQPSLSATLPVGTAPVSGTKGRDDAVSVIASEPQTTQGATAPTETKPQKLKTISPVDGQMVGAYAMEELSYNETTRDWRVHNGVDYPGELGDPVSAAADGTVISVREDDSLGTTVVLRHTGGYETTYQNLEETVPVQLGDKVVLGQTIGSVGATALTESAIGPHVHFSVAYQDMPMDPADFLNMA